MEQQSLTPSDAGRRGGRTRRLAFALACGAALGLFAPSARAQVPGTEKSETAARAEKTDAPAAGYTNYVVGPQDVLQITSYDETTLTGKFTVEADGTFTYPLIGRFRAGGLTLRAVEEELTKRLRDEGFFNRPQINVSVDQYKSQKVFVVGEVRNPGTYTLSGDMTLVEALARAGSWLASASGEAIIVHGNGPASGPRIPSDGDSPDNIVKVNLRDVENGVTTSGATLRDGDTIFVPRAPMIYVLGQVKNPNAYSLQQKETTVLQALSLAGGMTERGSSSRIQIIRIVNGKRVEIGAKFTDIVQPGDTIFVRERFF